MLTIDNSENIIERLVYAFYQEQELVEKQGSGSEICTSSRREYIPSRKEKILGQILDAAERFGKSEEWYLDLIFGLLQSGGSGVTMQTCEKIKRVVEQGARSPAFNTTHLRVLAVGKTMQVLAQRDYNLNAKINGDPHYALAYFALWVLGEYGDNAEDWNLSTIFETLARCLLINQAL
ncbi:hypothetical protein BGX21_008073 [Mortierella sp. AD011]|nr:hypothetical protein BGX21_008073 [Mortierella sp. AD011]